VDDAVGHRDLPVHRLLILYRPQSVSPCHPRSEGSEVGVCRGEEGDFVEDGVEVVAGVHSVAAGANDAGGKCGEFQRCCHAAVQS